MNQVNIALSAKKLHLLLEKYTPVEPEAALLGSALSTLIEAALAGGVSAPLEWKVVPGDFFFSEGNLGKYRDLESAYAAFKIELTGGPSPVLLQLKRQMQNEG
jgi:hypothetical protein